MRPSQLIALAALVTLTPACRDRQSVLDEGIQPGQSRKSHVIRRAEALASAHTMSERWERELRRRAQADPTTRFPNLDPSVLRRRLRLAANRHDFQVVSVRVLRPRQLAPKIVVRTTHYLELAQATGRILARLDPKEPTSDDRTGWRYEGFYFEAQDEHGVPFLIVDNFWRGKGPGGGQWARSEGLYPFERG